ncbi:hypothetical protein E4665_11605 [Sporolactobacillus shoreae]|uniref:Uncharacterized protein n=1 Tax=Sporolactobacillus shoreae TaxID=1465501 RepID=A0A4Z0GNM6_9BACL|nr:DUF6809 family protein [Sporolactobacillus shoreae]TGA97488.1 hypothetical protein E4665_11605 [Sporolactobacillus shoreae]
MDDALEKLYQQFYSIPRHTARAKRIEDNYQALKDHLNKEDFVTVLHLTDETNLQLREVSFDSFIRGFQLGWTLFHQMSGYQGLFQDGEGSRESGSDTY